MAKRFLSLLRLFSATSDPAGTGVGDTYYNSTDKKVRVYDGAAWNDAVTTGAAANGLPSGGTAGQHLVKTTSTDYDASFKSPTITLTGAVTATATSPNSSGNWSLTTSLGYSGTANQVFRYSAAGSLGFGAINLASTSAVSGTLPVGNGGTGATTASGALTSLGAAAAGANSDITSLSGLTTALSGAQGGTGVANTGKTVTLGGNLTTSGAYALTMTLTGTTSVSLPLSGRLFSTETNSITAAELFTAVSGTTGLSTGSLVFSTQPSLGSPTLTGSVYTSSSFYNAGLTSGRSVVVVGVSYQMGQGTTSSVRYKTDIEPFKWDKDYVLSLETKRFKYIKDVEAMGDAAPWHYGVLAEDVEKAGFEYVLDRDEKNRPDYVFWSERMPQVLYSVAQALNEENRELRASIAALTARLDAAGL